MYINEKTIDSNINNPNAKAIVIICDKCLSKVIISTDLFKEISLDKLILKDNQVITCNHCKNTHYHSTPILNKSNEYTPKCPTCSSRDIKRLSNTQKVTSAVAFGLFSGRVRKTFHCNNCKYDW